jgi:uncharacterized protein (DUF305 family)
MATIRVRLIALLSGLALAGCAGSQHAGHGTATSSVTQPAAHNAADVMFARHMIPHHQQALDMADMVPTRTHNDALLVVAVHIKTDQQAEITTLANLLAQWGEPPQDPQDPMDMAGLVDDATMSQLPSLTGADFDRLWTTAMISHHQGAVAMAQTELAQGQSPEATKLAGTIVTTQEREISYMNDLLSTSR